jgi:hypothetical protein
MCEGFTNNSLGFDNRSTNCHKHRTLSSLIGADQSIRYQIYIRKFIDQEIREAVIKPTAFRRSSPINVDTTRELENLD